MTKAVIFRDYQEQQSADHNNLQDFLREGLGFVSKDAITLNPRYAGFAAAKTGQTQLTVQPGRMYANDGTIYAKRETLVQSLSTYLPLTAMRYVRLSVFGQVNDVDIQERDFIVDVATRQTDPDSVAMTRSRDAVLVLTPGSESAEPLPPASIASYVAIADILLDTTQIVSVTMLTNNEVASTESLDGRTDLLEEFKKQVEYRILAMSSDIAALKAQTNQSAAQTDMRQVYQDLALLKATEGIPQDSVDYAADRFLDDSMTDGANALNLGYSARIEEGVRFPWANMDVKPLNIFSQSDPNASVNNGLLLPAFTSELKLAVSTYYASLGMAQYGFQTFDMVKKEMSRTVIRYGQTYTACTNSAWWNAATNWDPIARTFQRGGETFQIDPGSVIPAQFGGTVYGTVRYQQIWIDTVNSSYWDKVTTNIQISGAQIAQTFLASNDMWATKLGFYLAEKASNDAISLTLCEITAGVPDLSKVILHQSVDTTSLVSGQWVRALIQPTFLSGGKKYAMVLTSNANHKVGMASGQSYIDGTFFYSTDGSYYLGDLTKDMMFEVWGAKFNAPQVTIELEAWNLDGGIKAVMLNFDGIIPASCDLVFEVQPNGTGVWIPLQVGDDAFASTPPLVRARLRFSGTRDMMPGIKLTNSEMTLGRPATAFTHVSTMRTLDGPSSDITVEIDVEAYNETPHDISCELWSGSPLAKTNPATTTTTVVDANNGRLKKTYHFTPSAISSFAIVTKGATNSAGNTFHVAQRIDWEK